MGDVDQSIPILFSISVAPTRMYCFCKAFGFAMFQFTGCAGYAGYALDQISYLITVC